MEETQIEPEYQDEERPEVRGDWRPTTLEDVDWCLRRLAECRQEQEEIDAQLAAAIKAASDRAEKLKARAQVGVRYFEAQAQRWTSLNRDQIVKGGKKSRAFLHGSVGFRATTERLVVQDKGALNDWLLSQPIEKGLYRIKYEPEMRALQDHFKATGEIPPGCVDQPAAETLTVKAELPTAALAKKE